MQTSNPSGIDFISTEDPEPHISRRSKILKDHPEIKNFMVKYPGTMLWIVAALVLQVGMAFLVHDKAWWVIFLAIYGVGAFVSHASYTFIHEASHGMIFKGATLNRIAGLLANLTTGFPSSISFQIYHLQHHAHQGVHDKDADMPRKWEVWCFNHGVIGKSIWLALYGLIVASRSFTMRGFRLPVGWTIANYLSSLLFDAILFYFFGLPGLLYVLFSTIVGLGLHPVGARWIQEHFVITEGQETYSYYGPLNAIQFNIGYHNEHHDFPAVPWRYLPKIRQIAAPYYDSLTSHQSWTKVLWRFLSDPHVTLESRIEREVRFGIRR